MSAFGRRCRVQTQRLPHPMIDVAIGFGFNSKGATTMIAQRLIPLSRVIAPLLLSIALGCSEASPPLATAPDASAPLASHDIAPPGAIVLRGTVLTPEGAITHGYVEIGRAHV